MRDTFIIKEEAKTMIAKIDETRRVTGEMSLGDDPRRLALDAYQCAEALDISEMCRRREKEYPMRVTHNHHVNIEVPAGLTVDAVREAVIGAFESSEKIAPSYEHGVNSVSTETKLPDAWPPTKESAPIRREEPTPSTAPAGHTEPPPAVRSPFPADRYIPEQTTIPGSMVYNLASDPLIGVCPPVKRGEEPEIGIETWEPTDEQIEGSKLDFFTTEGVREHLAIFKNANEGGRAKRWIVHFRAWLRAVKGGLY